jgi:hypothetical protein
LGKRLWPDFIGVRAQKITKSKSWANIQFKSGKKWKKMPKCQQAVVLIKVVLQYSLKSWATFAMNSSGKIFLTPKMVH